MIRKHSLDCWKKEQKQKKIKQKWLPVLKKKEKKTEILFCSENSNFSQAGCASLHAHLSSMVEMWAFCSQLKWQLYIVLFVVYNIYSTGSVY